MTLIKTFTGEPEDDDNDFADEIEYGFNYRIGDYMVGLAGTTLILPMER